LQALNAHVSGFVAVAEVGDDTAALIVELCLIELLLQPETATQEKRKSPEKWC